MIAASLGLVGIAVIALYGSVAVTGLITLYTKKSIPYS